MAERSGRPAAGKAGSGHRAAEAAAAGQRCLQAGASSRPARFADPSIALPGCLGLRRSGGSRLCKRWPRSAAALPLLALTLSAWVFRGSGVSSSNLADAYFASWLCTQPSRPLEKSSLTAWAATARTKNAARARMAIGECVGAQRPATISLVPPVVLQCLERPA